ncbi:14066_t:CDS:2, partial [Dentiscutata heterogama]
ISICPRIWIKDLRLLYLGAEIVFINSGWFSYLNFIGMFWLGSESLIISYVFDDNDTYAHYFYYFSGSKAGGVDIYVNIHGSNFVVQ